ncbi:hypothetical protein [Hugenholtzia roseola]|uniref:hypothetical protein n=1 Tax=Hugenholtzia roseola TaxID=1002 RepID=UPI00040845AF|nr:hypothetical protein [Hugenholtzia roseola]
MKLPFLLTLFSLFSWFWFEGQQDTQQGHFPLQVAKEGADLHLVALDSPILKLKKPESHRQIKKLDNPVIADDPVQSDTNKTEKPQKNPFQQAISQHHNEKIKNFVKGRAYDLTGRSAAYAQEDSLIFKAFQYQKVLDLKDSTLIALGKILSDTTAFEKRNYEFLGVFAPTLGLELYDNKGNKTEYLFCFEILQAEVGKEKLPLSKKTTQKLQTCYQKLFPTTLSSKVKQNTTTAKNQKVANLKK